MNFTQLLYYVFLFAFVFGYWLLPSQLLRRRLLILASFAFYAAWDWRFFSLVLASGLVDYFLAIRAEQFSQDRRRKFIIASLTVNLTLLGFFKYFHFFVDSASVLLTTMGLSGVESSLQIILPLGISFYTFQTISYTIDVCRGDLRAERNFFDYFLYVSFFPQLVAGPIERAGSLLSQFFTKKTFCPQQFSHGVLLIACGLALKLLIADELADFVDFYFASPLPYAGAAWLAVFSFGYQIYIDFWAYTLIARGSGRLFGIELSENFRQPYLSATPSEFWRNWHITLSTWFRDYVYIPLGGNRRRVVRNLLLTMGLAGLWHGASVLFIIWGIYHGILLVAFRHIRLPRFVSWLITFLLVQLGWLFFRSPSLQAAGETLRALFQFELLPWQYAPAVQHACFLIVLITVIDVCNRYGAPMLAAVKTRLGVRGGARLVSAFAVQAGSYARVAAASTLAFLAIFFAKTEAIQFIYFNF